MKRADAKHPYGQQEWQEAADASKAALVLDAMYMFGLITPNPNVHIERCLWLLRAAAYRKIVPIESNVRETIHAFLTQPKGDSANAN